MNKYDLLKLLEELNFPKDQFYILSSGCLVFYNLRDMANDLDLCITENLFEQIKNKYDLNAEKKNKYGFYKLSDDIEVVVDSDEDFVDQFDLKDGYQVQKLSIIRDFKVKRGLSKDLIDIRKIDDYLNDKSLDI